MEDYKKLTKTDSLFKLADRCWTEYDSRRSYEWKINFGLWTSLGIISGFSIKESYFIGSWIWALIFLMACFYIRWQIGMFSSNKLDQNKRHFYESQVREEYKIKLPAKLNQRPITSGNFFLENWSHATQILFTFLLLIITGIILSGNPYNPKKDKKSMINRHIRYYHSFKKNLYFQKVPLV